MEALSAQDDSSGANPSSVKSDDSSPRPDSRSGSPPPNCAICLGTCKNKSFTDPCLHQFCFSCLLTWSKVKAECPLCKQAFRSIIHNVRSNHQYEEYLVVQRPTEESSSRIDIDRVSAATHRSRYQDNPYAAASRDYRDPSAFASHAHRASPASFRRTVYHHNLWARPLPDFTGRFLDCTPEFYRYNDTQKHRLVPWLNRELDYLLDENIGHISYVISRILDLLPQHHINSTEFREAMHRYFGDRTEHFLHELYCFASTPYDLTGYDRNVQYTTDGRISTVANEVISSSDTEASVESDIVMVPRSETAEPPPGPSRFPTPVYPQNYDDMTSQCTTLTLPRRETIAIQPRHRFPSVRRTVYHHNLWARPLPDFTGRLRDCTPESYRYNDTQKHRLVPWLNRELDYLLDENIGHISYVISRILDLLPQHHINSTEFREAMHRYFGDRTEHFLHELYCFASTPYDMTGYDRNVQYTTDGRISTVANEVISSSDTEASVESDIVMVSRSETAEPPPGPSRFPTPVYPQNYDDMTSQWTTLTLPRREIIAIQQLLRRYPFVGEVGPRAAPAQRRRSPASFRRTVYHHNLWARPLPDFTGRFRDCTPEFYRYNDTQKHRLVPWLNRELDYLLDENIGHISYVISRILDLLPQHHINSTEFREAMHRYFGDRTEHFLHELYGFASTPYDMTGYDRNVQYTTDSSISTMVNEVNTR